jgi:F-type H+-transporting ATPase subunit b
MINVDFSLVITIFYLIILYIFMSKVFFGPISRILGERRQLIEGRLEDANKRMAQVEQKAAEYENALKAARIEVYRLQEAQREKALKEKSDLVAKAKGEAEKAVQEGRTKIVAQADAAKTKLVTDVDTLARNLTNSILRD